MKFLLSDSPKGHPFPQAGDIACLSLPGPQGGWGRFRAGADGKLEFVSFEREPATAEETETLRQQRVATVSAEKQEEGAK